MRRRHAAVGLVATAALALAGPAAAITSYHSTPAPERTEVGALVVQWTDQSGPHKDWICSGTMVDRNTFLTAAHCTDDWPAGTRLFVTLAQTVDAAAINGSVQGTAHQDPAYPGTGSAPHDIAVIDLDAAGAAAVANKWSFTPATLPSAGYLDRLGPRGLRSAGFQVMGYGTEEAHRGPGGHMFPGGGTRLKAPVTFDALNKNWLRLSQNAAKGEGGACYGDSGGPNFLTRSSGRVLVSTTITGDVPCYATNVTYRLDTASARTFLAPYVALP